MSYNPPSRSFKCKTSPSSFCYICANFTFLSSRKKITPEIREIYKECFKMPLCDDQQEWAPSTVCSKCVSTLKRWKAGDALLHFEVPAIWRMPSMHPENCYFCMTETRGFNKTNSSNIKYPVLEACVKPQPFNGDNIMAELSNDILDDDIMETESGASPLDQESDFDSLNSGPTMYTQPLLNDLIRNCGMSKRKAAVLARSLKSTGNLDRTCKIKNVLERQKPFEEYFCQDDASAFCSDIE
jgi:hypothetical protein